MKKKEIKENKKFKSLLQSRNITAYQLSKRLGYKDGTTAYKWIYGKSEPSARIILKMSEILDVSAFELLMIFADP